MTEAEAILTIGLLGVSITLALILMIAGLVLKRATLCFGASGAWVIVMVVAIMNMGATFDIYWALLILGGALTIATIFEPISFKEATGGEEEDLDPDMADLRHFREEQEKEQEQYGFLYGGRRRHNRPGRTLYRNPPRR
jgi:hypothetical protein